MDRLFLIGVLVVVFLWTVVVALMVWAFFYDDRNRQIDECILKLGPDKPSVRDYCRAQVNMKDVSPL